MPLTLSLYMMCVCVGHAAELYLSLDMVKDAIDIVSVHDVCVCVCVFDRQQSCT